MRLALPWKLQHGVISFGLALVPGCASNSSDAGDTAADENGESGTGSDAGGVPCGNITCSETQYCSFAGDQCLTPDACVEKQDNCVGAPLEPVCGCDGMIYPSMCAAAMAGTDLDGDGTCMAPDGLFSCGYRLCEIGTQVCEASYVEGAGTSYYCAPVPPMCADDYTCDCILPTYDSCGVSNCSMVPEGGVLVHCSDASG